MFYFQLVIMAGTVLLAYYFEYTDTFPVHIQGFFCFDKAYSKPYPGPEDNSKAPPVLVYSLVTAIPTVTVSLCSTCYEETNVISQLLITLTRHSEETGQSPACKIACETYTHGQFLLIYTWCLWMESGGNCVGVYPRGLTTPLV